jgi:hypothetical protein
MLKPKKFESIQAYAMAASTSLEAVMVSIPMAAAYLDLKVSTVRQYLAAGKLQSVQIDAPDDDGGWEAVGLPSLVAFAAARDKEVNDNLGPVTKMLLAQAKEHETAPYARYMAPLGLKTEHTHDRAVIGRVLGAISERSWEDPDQKVMLSVLAVGKNTRRPNTAFFDLARDLGAMKKGESDEEFFKRMLKRVFKLLG